MAKIRRAPKKETTPLTHKFGALKKGEVFRIGILSKHLEAIFIKTEEFYTEDEDIINSANVLTGECFHHDDGEEVIKLTCYIESHDEVG